MSTVALSLSRHYNKHYKYVLQQQLSIALSTTPNTNPTHRLFSSSSSSSNTQGQQKQPPPPPPPSPQQQPPLATTKSWSNEWKTLNLGARLPRQPSSKITDILFVQVGFGVDQHGDRSTQGATKAAVRAVRNAIEFNSIPGAITAIPGGREEMLIHVKLGVPPQKNRGEAEGGAEGGEGERRRQQQQQLPMAVDLEDVAKVFPYGRLLPIEVVVGGLEFSTGRVVEELGDVDDMAVCCAACVTIGFDDGSSSSSVDTHKTYNTKDGY